MSGPGAFNSKWCADNVTWVGQEFHEAFGAGMRANAYTYRCMNLSQGNAEQRQAWQMAMRRLRVKWAIGDATWQGGSVENSQATQESKNTLCNITNLV